MKKAILIFLFFIAAQIVASESALIVAHFKGLGTDGLIIANGYGVLVWELLLCLVLGVVGLIRFRTHSARRRVGAGVWTGCVAGALLAAFGLSAALMPAHLPDGGSTAIFTAMTKSPVCIVLMTVLVPLFEELIFREGILRQLCLGGIRPIWAVLLSALVFSAVHVNLAQVVPAFVLGLVLGAVYLRSGDIRMSFCVHVLNNVAGVLTLLSPSAEGQMEAWPVLVLVGAGSLAILVGLVLVGRLCASALLKPAGATKAFLTTQTPSWP